MKKRNSQILKGRGKKNAAILRRENRKIQYDKEKTASCSPASSQCHRTGICNKRGAGAVLLSKNSADNKIMGIASECMSEFCMVTGFKYGGTRNDFSDKNIHNNKFCFDILEESHLKGVLDNIVSVSWEVVKKVLQKADMEINDIDFIGITGFHKRVNNSILKGIKTKAHIIEYIETKGYLGSVGSIEILNCFINNEKIQKDSKLLIIANGIDANVEAMIIKK